MLGRPCEDGRFRRGPCPRPIRTRNGDSQPVAGRHDLTDGFQRQADALPDPGSEHLGLLVFASMRQVQQPSRNEGGGAILMNVAKPHRDEPELLITGEFQNDLGQTKYRDRFRERFRCEGC